MAEAASNARGSSKARVRAELETVRAKSRGILRPAEVVDYARNPSTALHGYFDWKDGRAAESWRRHQARLLIQRFYIRVESNDRPSEVIRVREFTSLRNDRGRDSYRSLNDVRGDPSLYQSLVAQALAEAESWRSRYEHLAELGPIVRAIHSVSSRRRRKVERARPGRPRSRKVV